MELTQMTTISPVSSDMDEVILAKINTKTKPLGSLGSLESVAFKIARIQQTLNPKLRKPHIAVFAADHGIAKEGLVNPFPQEVTQQMVMNFLNGGAAINVFAKQNNITLKIIDAGVNFDFGNLVNLIDAKINHGTSNYLNGPAMSVDECTAAMNKGAEIVEQIIATGCNVIGFGEMGIGNTSSAALLMSTICSIPIYECVGKGTGVNDEQLKVKINTLVQVKEKHNGINKEDPLIVLQTFGGFEIAQMCGGMLKASELGAVVLIDGFISSAAALVAHSINKTVLDYCIFSHHSNEQGHTKMLDYLNETPLINIGMRLGEGSGIAVAYPLLESSCTFINEMASFEDAAVSNK